MKNEQDCEVWLLRTSALRRYKGNRGTRNRPNKFRDVWETGPSSLLPFQGNSRKLVASLWSASLYWQKQNVQTQEMCCNIKNWRYLPSPGVKVEPDVNVSCGIIRKQPALECTLFITILYMTQHWISCFGLKHLLQIEVKTICFHHEKEKGSIFKFVWYIFNILKFAWRQ